MFLQRKGIKSVRNQIIITEDGERIDLRKVNIGKIKHQGNYGTNKYGARSAQYNGVTYHSTAEAKYAYNLDLRLRAGEITGWKRQVRIPLKVNGYLIANYIIDFIVTHKDGTEEYTEIKGMVLPLWQIKWKLLEALYGDNPNIKLTVVKV